MAIEGDQLFTIPAVRLAEAQHRAGGQVWMYRFAWNSPANGGLLRAAHALDIPFVFDIPEPGPVWGSAPSRALAEAMHQSWMSFARTGEPDGVAGLPAWPSYDDHTRSVMRLAEKSVVVDDPQREVRELWAGAW